MARKNKPGAGRPTQYRQEYCELLLNHMAQGLSFESFGAEVNSDRSTIYEWLNLNPEFADAKKKGEAIARRFYEKLGLGGMTGKIKGFNAAMWIFIMKNRFGYADRVEYVNDGLPKKPDAEL